MNRPALIATVALVSILLFVGGIFYWRNLRGATPPRTPPRTDIPEAVPSPPDTTPERNGEKDFGLRPAPGLPDTIRVFHPVEGQRVTSPLTVEGEARGWWYFEADFPLRLLDGNGNEIAVGYAQAEGEWMTEKFVPFRGQLEFSAPRTDAGTLAFERANPSGLPEHAREVRVGVRFR